MPRKSRQRQLFAESEAAKDPPRQRPTVAQQIAKLRETLRRHDRLYYVEAAPEISDSEYDRMMNELIELERQYPELISPDSPTQLVGGKPLSRFRTVEHARPMYSIDNTYKREDLRKWAARCFEKIDPELVQLNRRIDTIKAEEEGLKSEQTQESRHKRDALQREYDQLSVKRANLVATGEATGFPVVGGYVAEPKVDGVALSLRYVDGLLALAVTRGDGRRGDDVTKNAYAIRSIPRGLKSSVSHRPPAVLEVRGEVVMPQQEFERINVELAAANQPLLVNPRNATAGTLKQLDPRAVKKRDLMFVAHGRGEIVGAEFTTYTQLRDALDSWGVPIGESFRTCDSIDDVWKIIEEFETDRHKLDFGVDGVVVKVNRFDFQETLGYTSKSPRWCIAYKYAAEQAVTTLISVDWQVGKTGKLTPRATMKPVFVGGTTVQHATLHNLGEIRRKDIHLGDRVVLEKAGEIIPQVVRVVREGRPSNITPIHAPTSCPECRGLVESEYDTTGKETARYCINPECPAQLRERLVHFVGRRQMDISGIGEEVIDQLLKKGLVSHFADLYELSIEQLADLTHTALLEGKETEVRLGESNASRIVTSLSESKHRGLARVLSSLGINHIGTQTGRIIASHVASIDDLLDGDEMFVRSTVSEKQSPSKLQAAIRAAKKFHKALHSAEGKKRIQHSKDAASRDPTLDAVKYFLDELPDGGPTWVVKWGKGGGKKDRLRDRYGSLDDLLEADIAELTALFDDEVVGKSLYEFLMSAEGKETISRLRKVGVDMKSIHEIHPPASGPLVGKSVVVTGKLTQYSRDEAQDLIQRLGGTTSDSVSKKTDMLVVGESPGSKLRKAQELGVTIVTEAELEEMLKSLFEN